ncbi:AcrR family transcriptional regulator [Paraburkholderia sp. EB58]|uniref:TetR/AcrR family transcriptional regulator n=1 Tax=Paraburkholderia sp. EB58 TaxID=3035125 RepID=UPI003D2467CB
MRRRTAEPAPYHHGDLRRALIAAALALVTEEQDWTFSLREVARSAGVSPSAPYNHFTEKRDLLAEVAVAGFHRLRDGLASAVADLHAAPEAFVACVSTYVRLGMENPALYRLMFGPELTASKGAERPPQMQVAGNEAKAILAQIIREGARSGDFAMSVEDERHVAIATFIAWSAVHGLTMLIIDNLTGKNVPVQRAIELAIQTQLDGLRHGIGAIS